MPYSVPRFLRALGAVVVSAALVTGGVAVATPAAAVPAAPTPPPGLYVQVVDGAIAIANAGGVQNLAAGQFGFVPAPQTPPVIVPTSPGLSFTPPPAFQGAQPAPADADKKKLAEALAALQEKAASAAAAEQAVKAAILAVQAAQQRAEALRERLATAQDALEAAQADAAQKHLLREAAESAAYGFDCSTWGGGAGSPGSESPNPEMPGAEMPGGELPGSEACAALAEARAASTEADARVTAAQQAAEEYLGGSGVADQESESAQTAAEQAQSDALARLAASQAAASALAAAQAVVRPQIPAVGFGATGPTSGGAPAGVLAGQVMTLALVGGLPGTIAGFGINSTPTLLATATFDANGIAVATFSIPAGYRGNHTLVATGVAPDGSVLTFSKDVTVSASAGLAETGLNATAPLLFAGAIVIAGSILLLVRRRRSIRPSL